jgi:hypothetical protein
MRDEIMRRYRSYVPFAMARLGCWTFAVGLFFALPGSILAVTAADALSMRHNPFLTIIAATLSQQTAPVG